MMLNSSLLLAACCLLLVATQHANAQDRGKPVRSFARRFVITPAPPTYASLLRNTQPRRRPLDICPMLIRPRLPMGLTYPLLGRHCCRCVCTFPPAVKSARSNLLLRLFNYAFVFSHACGRREFVPVSSEARADVTNDSTVDAGTRVV